MGAIVPQWAHATSDSTGAAVFVFDTPPLGKIWAGTMAVPLAPASAIGQVLLGGKNGIAVGQIVGFNFYGPYTADHSQRYAISMTGLVATTQYQAVWVVDTDSSGEIPSAVTQVTQLSNTSETINVVVQPPFFGLSDNLTLTGSAQTLPATAIALGVAFLTPSTNTGLVYISSTASVSTASGYLTAGQGVTLPLPTNKNLNGFAVLGSVAGDIVSFWGA